MLEIQKEQGIGLAFPPPHPRSQIKILKVTEQKKSGLNCDPTMTHSLLMADWWFLMMLVWGN